jgi:hypothetical protein
MFALKRVAKVGVLRQKAKRKLAVFSRQSAIPQNSYQLEF